MSTKKKGAGPASGNTAVAPDLEMGRIWYEAVAPLAKKYWPEATDEDWNALSESDRHFINDQANAFLAALETAKRSAKAAGRSRPKASPQSNRRART